MKSLKWISPCGANGLAIFGLAAMAAVIQAQDEAWRPLFDGKSMAGWTMVGPGEFTIEDGALVTHGGMGLLYYDREKIGDAELRVVFKTTKPSDNSGVFIRIKSKPPDPWFGVHNGYEVQIDNRGDEWHRTGALYSLAKVKAKAEAKPGGWTTMVIRLDGDKTTSIVNGTEVMEYNEGQSVPERKASSEPERGPRAKIGYIGLQNHDGNSRVMFREISVRPLVK